MIDALPDEVFEMAKKLPIEVRKQFVSAMDAVEGRGKMLYNPEERFIDYVLPGVIGIILQLITVTLMACTIARERESGTLYQLMVTSLRRSEIVIGKILPYLAISVFLILVIILADRLAFPSEILQPGRAGADLLSCSCSVRLGLGLLISAVSRTQTQAIQFSVFFLLPVFILSGAFAPLEQLPDGDPLVSELFPAHPFLSRLSDGESLPRRAFLLRSRFGHHVGRSGDYFPSAPRFFCDGSSSNRRGFGR